MKLFLGVVFILGLILFYCSFTKTFYISKSKVQGEGLFANKNFKKNEIIIDDLFPYNKNRKVLKEMDKNTFDDYIIKEGRYINHCETKANADVISDDNIYLQLIATKDIQKGQEIISNYDTIHQKFPFIAKSKPHFRKC
jgi:hypothetical protein